MKIIIDAAPLGLLTNKNTKNIDITECRKWAKSLLQNGFKICIPEIAYYEVRRELVRTQKLEGIKRLDTLKDVEGFEYAQSVGEENCLQLICECFDYSIVKPPSTGKIAPVM